MAGRQFIPIKAINLNTRDRIGSMQRLTPVVMLLEPFHQLARSYNSIPVRICQFIYSIYRA